MFNIRFDKKMFGFWSFFFFLFLPFEDFGMDAVSVQWRFTTRAMRSDRVYCLSPLVEISRSTRAPVMGNETVRVVDFSQICRSAQKMNQQK